MLVMNTGLRMEMSAIFIPDHSSFVKPELAEHLEQTSLEIELHQLAPAEVLFEEEDLQGDGVTFPEPFPFVVRLLLLDLHQAVGDEKAVLHLRDTAQKLDAVGFRIRDTLTEGRMTAVVFGRIGLDEVEDAREIERRFGIDVDRKAMCSFRNFLYV